MMKTIVLPLTLLFLLAPAPPALAQVDRAAAEESLRSHTRAVLQWFYGFSDVAVEVTYGALHAPERSDHTVTVETELSFRTAGRGFGALSSAFHFGDSCYLEYFRRDLFPDHAWGEGSDRLICEAWSTASQGSDGARHVIRGRGRLEAAR